MNDMVKTAFFNEIEKRSFDILQPVRSLVVGARRGIRQSLGRTGAKNLRTGTKSMVGNFEVPALIGVGGVGMAAMQPRNIPM
jgi:hypothetical protein